MFVCLFVVCMFYLVFWCSNFVCVSGFICFVCSYRKLSDARSWELSLLNKARQADRETQLLLDSSVNVISTTQSQWSHSMDADTKANRAIACAAINFINPQRFRSSSACSCSSFFVLYKEVSFLVLFSHVHIILFSMQIFSIYNNMVEHI